MNTLDDYIYTAAGQYLCSLRPVQKAIDEKQNDILCHIEPKHHWEPYEEWTSDDLAAQIHQTAEAFWRLRDEKI